MPADARLALAKRLREFADRQLALSQQRQRPEPGLLTRRPERGDDAIRVAQLRDRLSWRYKHIFI